MPCNKLLEYALDSTFFVGPPTALPEGFWREVVVILMLLNQELVLIVEIKDDTSLRANGPVTRRCVGGGIRC